MKIFIDDNKSKGNFFSLKMFISFEQSQALKVKKDAPKADLLFSDSISTEFDDWFTVSNEKNSILENKKFIEDVFTGLLNGTSEIDAKT